MTEEIPDNWIQTYPQSGFHVVALGINDTVSVSNINFGNRYIFKTNCQKGWNMVSVPVKVTDRTVDSLFPGAATSAYAYKGSYVEYDSLVNKVGYWIKFDNPQSVNFPGIPILSDTFDLQKGWNLIGSISMPIADSNLSTLPRGVGLSRLFTYTGNYSEVREITPGQGYWIKADDSCKLLLSHHTSLTARAKFMSVSDLPPLPPGEEILSKEKVPAEFSLSQNYPNPFNPMTTINYGLPEGRHVRLDILNILGQVVLTLVDQYLDAGFKSITFDASSLASGIYYYRIMAGDFIQTKKMVLIQ